MKLLNRVNGYSYLKPLIKSAHILLEKAKYNNFSMIIKEIKNKHLEYIFIDDVKYYVEYLDTEEKWQKRYKQMVKNKEFKITKRNGTLIEEIVSKVDYDIFYNLENYFLNKLAPSSLYFADGFNFSESEEFIKSLLAKKNINFPLDFIDDIKKEYEADNRKFTITHDQFMSYGKIVSYKEYDILVESYNRLRDSGHIITALYYSDYGDLYFTILTNREYKKLLKLEENLNFMGVTNISTIFRESDIEDFFTIEESILDSCAKHKEEIESQENEIVYIISASNEKPITLSQYAGEAITILDSDYPMYDDKKMEHLITIDLEEFPVLQDRFPTTGAITVFISDFLENEAYEAFTPETKVMLIPKENLKAIEQKEEQHKASGYKINVLPIKIPKGLLNKDTYKLDKEDWRYELLNSLLNISHVGGDVVFYQNDEYNGNFIMHIEEVIGRNLKELNFGGGIMYVFDDTAFFQC